MRATHLSSLLAFFLLQKVTAHHILTAHTELFTLTNSPTFSKSDLPYSRQISEDMSNY